MLVMVQIATECSPRMRVVSYLFFNDGRIGMRRPFIAIFFISCALIIDYRKQ